MQVMKLKSREREIERLGQAETARKPSKLTIHWRPDRDLNPGRSLDRAA